MKRQARLRDPGKALWLKKTGQWWPAVKGSLARVHKPCIRQGCALCRQGKKHPAYLYTYTDQRKRRCLYVPLKLVPLLAKALKNGRHLEQWLYAQGPALIQQYRQQRDAH